MVMHYMFYFVGVDPVRVVNTILVSMFQKDLLQSTILLKHWAGRNSRGVTQFEGKQIGNLIVKPCNDIVDEDARTFLERIIAL